MSLHTNTSMLPFTQRYKIGEQLGVGATAVVHRIVHNSTGNTYAAKIISKTKLNPGQICDLEMEISTMKELNHDSIVHLKETKEEGDKVYLVLEEMHGGELFDRICDQGALSEKKAKELFFNLTCAVAYCHRKGVVHRDLKPENILLKSHNSGDEHNVKLADFGIAAHLPKRLVNVSSQEQEKAQPFSRLCGSPEYMAPEVIRADRKKKRGYGPKCDIWSLGVILFILLSGEPPFDAADFTDEDEDEDEQEGNGGPSASNLPDGIRQLFKVICRGQIEMTGSKWKKISQKAKDLITHMLSIRPSDRPTAHELLCDPWFVGMVVPTSIGAPVVTGKKKKKKTKKKSSKASKVSSLSFSMSISGSETETDIERMAFLKRREFLLDIGAKFSRATKLHKLLEQGVHHCRALMNCEVGSLWLIDYEQKQMWTEVSEGIDRIVIPLGVGLVGACFKEKKMLNITDANSDSRFNNKIDKDSGYVTRSLLCQPVIDDDGSVIAVIQMINKMPNHHFNENDINLLEDFSVHIALALRRVNALENGSNDAQLTFATPSASSVQSRKKRSRQDSSSEEESDNEDSDDDEVERRVKKKRKENDGKEEQEESVGSSCILQ